MEMKEYLDAVHIPLRLACKTKTGWPMLISLWFVHKKGLLYCATQKSAKVVEYLQNDDRCAFEIAGDQPPYCGIRGQARTWLDEALGVEILEELLVRYLGSTNNDLARNLLAKSKTEIAIVLEPIRIFKWDFSNRMMDISTINQVEKICP
jgi:hypothetical protein